MRCPYCRSVETDVVETRCNEEGSNVRRRRICSACEKRFTTYERIENIQLVVHKRDGTREQFDRDKLKTGLIRACEKTDISLDSINNIVDEIERELRGSGSIDVESARIGLLVADRLKALDKVAYIRFASVFKRFVDLEDFAKELHRLVKYKQ